MLYVPEELIGVVYLYSDAHTQGSVWAFQDARYIAQNNQYFACTKCGLAWDRAKETLEVCIDTAEKRRRGYKDQVKSLFSADLPNVCARDAHVFAPTRSQLWTYGGLYILENDDELTIIHPADPMTTIWAGIIEFIPYVPFTESTHGLWIHSDQEGVSRELWASWFVGHYPAKLVKHKPSGGGNV